MNTPSRQTNNGVAAGYPVSVTVTKAHASAVERGAATTGDTEKVPNVVIERNGVTPPPQLSGHNGENHACVPCHLKPPSDFRDARGRFTKGNPGGRGIPFRRRTSFFRRAISRAVSPADLNEITATLIRDSKAGDHAAQVILLAYIVGRPTSAPDPDLDDVHEWQVNKQRCVTADEFTGMLDSLPADTACTLVEKLWPVFLKKFKQDLLTMATHPPTEPMELQPAPGLNVPSTDS